WMLAWINCVELVTADPWMAIDAQRPVVLEKATRWRPKLSGAAAIKTSSPDAASRKPASKCRSKKAPVSIGLVETDKDPPPRPSPTRGEEDLSLGGRMDQPRAAASSRTATWYFAARSRARPDGFATNSQRSVRPPERSWVQTSASLVLENSHAGSTRSRIFRSNRATVKSRWRLGCRAGVLNPNSTTFAWCVLAVPLIWSSRKS